MSSTPALIAKRYQLTRLLGNGGMGRVWLAQDVKLDRRVAVKEIIPPKGLSPREREEVRLRTLREARTAASLSHPNVVRVFDTMNIDDQPWIVMEYVPSRSLQEVIDDDGPLPPERVAEIGLSVLAALRTAHAAGVLHRDVKPGNVLLAEDGRVVLTDFGLATFDGDAQVTRTGLILGSPLYISPERASKGVSLPESDLWSFGATLYAAVEGRAPYARANALATLTALVTQDPDPSPNAGPLQPVLDALLRKDPAQRPSAPAVERQLRRVVAGSRLRHGASPAPQQPRRLSLRNLRSVAAPQAATPQPPTAQPPTAQPAETPQPRAAQPEIRPAATAEAETIVQGQPVSPAPATQVLPPHPAVAAAATTKLPTPAVAPRVTEDSQEPRTTAVDLPRPQLPERTAAGQPWHKNRFLRFAVVAIVLALAVAALANAVDSSGDDTPAGSTQPSSSAHRAAVASPAPSATTGTSAARTSSAAFTPTPASSPTFALPQGWVMHQDPTGFQVAVPAGWNQSRDGTMVYFREPGGGRVLLIDQTTEPRSDPVADWQSQEVSRSRTLANYQRVQIVRVKDYFLDCADWEYSYNGSDGSRVHVLDRGFVTGPNRAYAIFWLTPDAQWQASYSYFTAFAQSFRPAA